MVARNGKRAALMTARARSTRRPGSIGSGFGLVIGVVSSWSGAGSRLRPARQPLLERRSHDLLDPGAQGAAEEPGQGRDVARGVDLLGVDPHLDPEPRPLQPDP